MIHCSDPMETFIKILRFQWIMLSIIHSRPIRYRVGIFGVHVFGFANIEVGTFRYSNAILNFFFNFTLLFSASYSLLLLFVFYTSIFISVRQTKRKAPRGGPSADSDFDLAVRFFFIVLANVLCWLPIIILKIAALRKFHISSGYSFYNI